MQILKNKVFVYLFTRYFTYGLQFIMSLIIAVRLGPYYLGIYGIIQLILNYINQINFGIPHSLNVLLVHNKQSLKKQNSLIINSLVLYSYLNFFLLLVLGIVKYFKFTEYGEIDIDKYLVLLSIIAALTYYNSIFSTVIRFKNKVNQMSIIGSIPVFVDMCVVWFFEKEELVMALTMSNLISCSFTIVYYKCIGVYPKCKKDNINISMQSIILKKGLYLFMYNSCLYFMLLGIRTIVSTNYSIKEFGYFTFSFTIVNAIMLLLNSLDVIVFPKVIDKLSVKNNNECVRTLNIIRIGYVLTSHFLIYIALLAFPIFLIFFPGYKGAIYMMDMIALAVLMRTNSYGYNSLLIAQNKEKIASQISIVSLITSITLGLLFSVYFHLAIPKVVMSILIAYLVCSVLMTIEGRKLIINNNSLKSTLKHCFPLRLFVPYTIALFITLMECESLMFLPLIIFLLLNYRELINIRNMAMKFIKNPNIIDL